VQEDAMERLLGATDNAQFVKELVTRLVDERIQFDVEYDDDEWYISSDNTKKLEQIWDELEKPDNERYVPKILDFWDEIQEIEKNGKGD
jgi:hypothetical protein